MVVVKNGIKKSSKGQIWGCAHRPRGTCSLPAVYLQFTCCLLVAHTMCVASPMGMQGANNDQCMCPLVPTGHAKPKRGLGPLAMPRHSHFLTLCQEYPGGPKLLLSLFLKFATSQVAQNPHQHGSGATANHTSTNCQVAIGAPKAHMGGTHCLAPTFFNIR